MKHGIWNAEHGTGPWNIPEHPRTSNNKNNWAKTNMAPGEKYVNLNF